MVNFDPNVYIEMRQHEIALINALEVAHSSTSQKAKKVGALILASTGAALAFVLQGIWSVGGLREKWFVSLPEYGVVKRIWQSTPLSIESAKKVVNAYQAVHNYYDNTFSLETYDNQNDPRYEIYQELKSCNYNIKVQKLMSLINNRGGQELSSIVEKIKKIHSS